MKIREFRRLAGVEQRNFSIETPKKDKLSKSTAVLEKTFLRKSQSLEEELNSLMEGTESSVTIEDRAAETIREICADMAVYAKDAGLVEVATCLRQVVTIANQRTR